MAGAMQAEPAPDAGKKTLHLRCGHDIKSGLHDAGFAGEFQMFAYPFVHGPAPKPGDRRDFIETATNFLVGAGLSDSVVETRYRLIEEFAFLDASIGFERVCLWFEHDSYDLLCLVFLLDWYSKHGTPEELTFVCCDGHPSVDKFLGLGQLSPAALRDVWSLFAPVTPDILEFGSRCWNAFADHDPSAMWRISDSGTPEIPAAAAAFKRQLMELPDRKSGLSLSEYLTLQVLQEHGPVSAGNLFRRYTLEYEPLVFMGDLGFRQCVLAPMGGGDNPAVTLSGSTDSDDWWQTTTADITDIGRDLLAGKADWLDIAPVDRWVGGVHVKSGAPGWRWCAETGAPVEIQ
tara:strand:+ start:13863 stop:14900 length:1038 start_codon:yes stop_codon:yes gene_type:complete